MNRISLIEEAPFLADAMAGRLLFFTSLLMGLVPSAVACAQEASVPPVVIRSVESHAENPTVTYAGLCDDEQIFVRLDADDPLAPQVTVSRGQLIRTFEKSEPFVNDLFLGNRYEMASIRCYGDGISLLVLLAYSRGVEDMPVFAVGSVYFDGELNIANYDGVTEEPAAGSLNFVNRDFYERAARCEAEFETQAEVEACTYPDRRRSGD